jgi:hypothetical protein
MCSTLIIRAQACCPRNGTSRTRCACSSCVVTFPPDVCARRYNFKSDPRSLGAVVLLSANESSYTGPCSIRGIQLRSPAHSQTPARASTTRARRIRPVRGDTHSYLTLALTLARSVVSGARSRCGERNRRPLVLHLARAPERDLAGTYMRYTRAAHGDAWADAARRTRRFSRTSSAGSPGRSRPTRRAPRTRPRRSEPRRRPRLRVLRRPPRRR